MVVNVITCILYPAHTILMYGKTHDDFVEPLYVTNGRAMVNPYDKDEERLMHNLFDILVFMTTLSEVEITLFTCECIFIINIFINFFLQENDDAKIPFR